MPFFHGLNNSENLGKFSFTYDRDIAEGDPANGLDDENNASSSRRYDLGDGSQPFRSTGLPSQTIIADGVKTYTVWYNRDEDITDIDFRDSGWVGQVDLTQFTNANRFVFLDVSANGTMANVTGFTFPSTSAITQTIALYRQNGASFNLTHLDFSPFANIGGAVTFYNQENLTGVTLPTTNPNNEITYIAGSGCDLLVSDIDLSTLRFGGGNDGIYFQNTGINSLTLPVEANISSQFNRVRAFNCDNLVDVDVSVMGDMIPSLSIDLYNSNSLTGVTFPTTNSSIGGINVYNCNLTGVVNLTGLTNIYSAIRFDQNPNMTDILLPVISNELNVLELQNNGSLSFSSNGGHLDLSTTLSGGVKEYYLHSIGGMSEITFPNTNTLTTVLYLYHGGANTNLKELDLSPIQNLGGQIRFYRNSALSAVTNPNSSEIVNSYWGNECNITGNLDVSTMSNWGGNIRLFDNTSLTGITLPTGSTKDLNRWELDNCDITGHLDLSVFPFWQGSTSTVFTSISLLRMDNNVNLTGFTFMSASTVPGIRDLEFHNCDLRHFDNTAMGVNTWGRYNSGVGNLYLYGNTNLTGVTLSNTNKQVGRVHIYNCNIQGELDLSPISNFDYNGANNSELLIQNNTGMTNVILPTATQPVADFDGSGSALGVVDFTPWSASSSDNISIELDDNNMTAAEVNENLVNIDDTGWINGSLLIHGTNAAPDGTSGGFNGTGATANLITNGWSVTTS